VLVSAIFLVDLNFVKCLRFDKQSAFTEQMELHISNASTTHGTRF